MKSKQRISTFIIIIFSVVILYLATIREVNQYYYPMAIGMLLLWTILFILSFENKKPQAKEVVLIATLSALAVVSRTIFFMVPSFKPMTAIIMLSGIALGGHYGFLIGAISGFVSNFVFSQGPWTIWQMFAWGMVGWLSGILFSGTRRKYADKLWILILYGFVVTVFVYGIIMDTQSLLFMLGRANLNSMLGVYLAGLPFNLIHGASTAIFTLLLSKLFLKQMKRIQNKFGIRV